MGGSLPGMQLLIQYLMMMWPAEYKNKNSKSNNASKGSNGY
jgi:hypothetical protein